MLHVKGNLHILILLCSAYYICVCVVNPIVSKMSDIISKKIKFSKIKVSNLSSLIIVILFPQCVLIICIVYFRHPGYIYGVQRAT